MTILHQIAPQPLTPQSVLATFAVLDEPCTFDDARQIADRCNDHGGNLTRACPGWHQPLYRPFLAYANALLCERDPAEHGAWLITCAGDAERRGDHAAAADFRRREAQIARPAVEAALRASVRAVSA